MDLKFTDQFSKTTLELKTKSVDANGIVRFIKKHADEIGKLVSYFGRVDIDASDSEAGELKYTGYIEFNCFAGRDYVELRKVAQV